MNSPIDPRPWLIITMQRCGGTSMSQFLDDCSPFETIEDEPFQSARAYGAIVKEFRDTGDMPALNAGVAQALAQQTNIKHCLCTCHPSVTRAVIDAANVQNRPVVLLLRRDERARFRSLMIAKSTKLWFRNRPKIFNARVQKIKNGELAPKPINLDKVESRMRDFAQRKRATLAHMDAINMAPIRIFYEDFYHPETLAQNAIDLAVQLGMDCATDAPHLTRLINIDPNRHRDEIERMPPNLRAFDEMLSKLQP